MIVGTLAVAGAAGGGAAGASLAPDITGVIASLAVAGFGLGGALGVLFGGGWRSPKSEPEPAPAPEPAPEPEPVPDPDPPESGEPGWYAGPDGTRRYWDGAAWTSHVWRERRRGRPDTRAARRERRR